ncbi:hypothetical protein BDV41DRAFT_349979 [Aspergillus transmontanensis]|uniref:Uncharacterized protein n=1 Tax=Aspergillus transmontanensis TaxID=1034304 RepID=A0A5N6VU11_9EURO|nr:hypothetical protein BDV41DRAFT_349979 [Aspergillus transmontanensis]
MISAMESHPPGYYEYPTLYPDMTIPTTEISDNPVTAEDPFAFPGLEVQSAMISTTLEQLPYLYPDPNPIPIDYSHQGITSPEDAHQSP